jgi:UDP-N-acetylglucosamine 2-epimerase (non-hydrolysing)/GDP/UDP-N,N'-diacetylbacillosamine 2-epimerase (hydrolysing)
VAAGEFASAEEIGRDLSLRVDRPTVLFCQHSVTTEFDQAEAQLKPSIEALTRLAAHGVQIVLTYPNNDAGGRRIIDRLLDLDRQRVPNIQLHKSLGRHRFHGLLNFIGHVSGGAMVGNSSAGIKETPAFGCPAVNIGFRQQGRLRGDNVLDVPYDAQAIEDAVISSIEDADFRRRCREGLNPYGAGDAGKRIADVLATIDLSARLLQKRMTY